MNIQEDVQLAPYTTFHIGGRAKYFAEVACDEDFISAVDFAHHHDVPVFVLGGGSNLLISDKGYDGLVVHMTGERVDISKDIDSVLVVADAGTNWDSLVGMCVERGLHGFENLSGVPGSVGATPIQNIGAYGAEVGTFIEWVDVFDARTRQFKRLSKLECKLGYRSSVFKHKDGRDLAVLRVAYRLKSDGNLNINYKDLIEYKDKEHTLETLADLRNAVLTIRGRKFPAYAGTTIGTAGSFFKNPIVSSKQGAEFKSRFPDAPSFPQEGGNIKLSAAWIIDHILAMKGVREGAVGTWEAQALVIINYGGAEAHDVSRFAAHIIARAKNETGIILEPEVVYVGKILN